MERVTEPIRVESPRVGIARGGVLGVMAFLAGVVIAVTAGLLLGGSESSVPGWLTSLMILLPTLAGAGLAISHRVGRHAPGAMSVRDGVLTIETNGSDEKQQIPFSQLESGWYVPAEQQIELRDRSGGRYTATLDPDEADRVLKATGLSSTQRAMTIPLRGTIGTPVRAMMGFMLAAIPNSMVTVTLADRLRAPPVLFVVAFLAMQVAAVAATVRWFGAPRVIVGADGLTLVQSLRKRFIPYVEIASVVQRRYSLGDPESASGIDVALRSGERVLLPLIGQSDATFSAIAERIESARRAPTPLTGGVALAAIARNGRTLDQWRADLAKVLNAQEGYRAIQLSREDLEAALADAKAPPEQRVSAAFALSVLGGEGASERIRVAAEATASVPVRVALDRIAAGDVDEGAVEAALASARKSG